MDRSALRDAVVRTEAWITSHEATWDLLLAGAVFAGVAAMSWVVTGTVDPGEAITYAVPFTVVSSLIDATTGTDRWPDSE